MFNSLDVLQTAMDMARHAGARQSVVAANLANADTPGYRARSVAPFADVYGETAALAPARTRPGHLGAPAALRGAPPVVSETETAPNGNSVSVETEMLRAVEIEREHGRALTIYKQSLDLLRLSLGRR